MRMILASALRLRGAAACLLLLGLGACSKGEAGANPGVPASSARQYHLVTQVRPESVDGYFARMRALHKLCATAASTLGTAVKPFPRVPDDFVVARNIYASDGKRVFSKEIKWTMDDSRFAPETGCEFKLTTLWKSALIQDGKERSADFTDEQGVVQHEAQPASAEAVTASRLAMYGTAKNERGVQLKCSAEGNCIVDPALALIQEGPRPVHVVERIKDGGANGTTLIVEPVSLSVGKAPDPAVFNMENAQ